MILKIVKTFVPPAEKGFHIDAFFDGFDYVTKRYEQLQLIEGVCNAYPSSYFTDEKTEIALIIFLMKGNQISRYLAIDGSYSVYLMSDTGKTIEKLN